MSLDRPDGLCPPGAGESFPVSARDSLKNGGCTTQVLVDIDQQELSRAKDILGTTKNTEAVRMAVREVIAAKARREIIEMFSDGFFGDLGDPDVRAAAWS